jgi:hypothetical protein
MLFGQLKGGNFENVDGWLAVEKALYIPVTEVTGM